MMDVFVIPIGRDRYELYCEGSADGDDDEAPVPSAGLVGKLRRGFGAVLRAAEERQHRRRDAREADEGDESKPGLFKAVQDRILGWVAQRIAEQRLLWNLRRQTAAVAAHPEDMTFEQVLTLVRRTLQRDYERHRRWIIFDGMAFLVTFVVLGPFFLLVPGVANLPAGYFGFRVVGHWLSMRGASQGLHRVSWSGRPCPPLAELRDVAMLEPVTRDARIHDVATRLRLQHLTTFFERVAVRHA